MSQTNESAYNFYILDKSSEQLQLTKTRQRKPNCFNHWIKFQRLYPKDDNFISSMND